LSCEHTASSKKGENQRSKFTCHSFIGFNFLVLSRTHTNMRPTNLEKLIENIKFSRAKTTIKIDFLLLLSRGSKAQATTHT
ncbi:MAG: hypothetical protein IIW53_05235, partial [Rikenellaceae bacterium]|nr:hypothetical protein [Rikenellaceae bacterium]